MPGKPLESQAKRLPRASSAASQLSKEEVVWEEGKRQKEKPQCRHRHTVSPSSPPRQCRVTTPHEDGTALGPKACSSWGEFRGLPAPAGATAARGTPSPGTYPRITHGTLIHHVHAAPHARHPRAGASRHPPTPAPVPELHPSGSRVFPSSQVQNELFCSSPRQSIPVEAAAANTASAYCSTQFRQAAAGHGSVRGATYPPNRTAPS